MPLEIGRMNLTLTGVSTPEGERLARLVADKLGTAALEGLRPQQRERVSAQVAAAPGEDADLLADRIVAEVLRELGRQF